MENPRFLQYTTAKLLVGRITFSLILSSVIECYFKNTRSDINDEVQYTIKLVISIRRTKYCTGYNLNCSG